MKTLCIGVCILLVILALAFPSQAKVGVQTMPPVQLVAGANLVGWPLLMTVPLTDALGACWPLLVYAYGYDANDTADPWEKWRADAPYPFLNDMQTLEYARGYWLGMSAPCTWTPGVTP